MKGKRSVLCILAAAVFMLCCFRTGCRIIVDDRVLPGVYAPAAAQAAAAAAQRTAEEITRSAEEPPFTLVPVLCLQPSGTDETLLYHTLLESYEGVKKLYAVSVDGKELGMLGSLWEVSAIMRDYPAHRTEISVKYAHPDAADSLTHVRTVLRELDTGSTGPF